MSIFRLIGVIAFSTGIYGCSNTPNESQPEPVKPAVVEPAPAPAPKPAPPVPAAPPSKAKPVIAPVIEVYRGGAPGAPNDTEPARKKKLVPHPKHLQQVGDETNKSSRVADKATLIVDESASLNKYAVRVQATENMTLDLNKSAQSAGVLRVWIGQPGYEPPTAKGMSAASGILETVTKAESAMITPDFSDPLAFDAEPKESKCQDVEPRRSEVTFAITQKKDGDYKVGAKVELFKSVDCTGSAITRTAEPIAVKVSVSISKLPFYQEIWNAFMNFFKEFLAICFALLLFLFRKKLKQIFSFEKKS